MTEPDFRRCLLVGTPAAVQELAITLRAHRPEAAIIGCVVTTRPGDEAVTPEILGTLDELQEIVERERPTAALVSFPLNLPAPAKGVTQTLDRAAVSWRFVPTLTDQFAGRAASLLRGVAPAASAMASPFVDPVVLLDRRPHPLDEAALQRTLADRVVLITGAGGSIGSELARQVARFGPAKLVLLERSENALFEIDRQIGKSFPQLRRGAVLHDVTNAARTLAVITAQKPNVIFHAAAHKHVPMMEDHPAEAVENNLYGTRSIADAAHANAVDRFVMISSDKAVNPSSVMGATKRLAELYIQHLNQRSDTVFSMVRFGNVLGSACSVLPIWSQQIAQGHPVTVTHPDMQRYFMTIPEAAGLVLQSAALAGISTPGVEVAGGEIFLLDMGAPIRVLEMARRFIRSQGLEPDVDVRIEFTGIRPGEKLFEELAYHSEDMIPTSHAGIRVWSTTPPDRDHMRGILARFDKLRHPPGASHPWQGASRDEILALIRAGVPEMLPTKISTDDDALKITVVNRVPRLPIA